MLSVQGNSTYPLNYQGTDTLFVKALTMCLCCQLTSEKCLKGLKLTMLSVHGTSPHPLSYLPLVMFFKPLSLGFESIDIQRECCKTWIDKNLKAPYKSSNHLSYLPFPLLPALTKDWICVYWHLKEEPQDLNSQTHRHFASLLTLWAIDPRLSWAYFSKLWAQALDQLTSQISVAGFELWTFWQPCKSSIPLSNLPCAVLSACIKTLTLGFRKSLHLKELK